MHWRRLASLLLGAWMFGLVCAAYYVSVNSSFASRVLNSPARQTTEILQPIGDLRSQLVLSHMAAEQNRFFLARFSEAEIALGVLLTAAMFLSNHVHKLALVMSGAMTAITILLRFFIGAQLATVGRGLDFIPDAGSTEQGATLWTLQLTYSALVVVKALLGVALAWYLLTFKTKLRHSTRVAAS